MNFDRNNKQNRVNRLKRRPEKVYYNVNLLITNFNRIARPLNDAEIVFLTKLNKTINTMLN